MLAVALALGASLSWGVADFLGAVKSRVVSVVTVVAVSQAMGLATVAAFTFATGRPLPDGLELVAAVGAGVSGAVGLGAFYRGMAVGAIGVVAPISALAAALPFAAGIATGDRPGVLQVAGAVVALVGVVLVSREPGAEGATRVAAGVGLALLAALGFGTFFVCLDVAGDDGVAGAVTVARVSSVSVALLVLLVVRAPLRPRARHLPVILLLGVFDMTANALFAVAAQEGLVSVVSVLASLYPVVTIALAHLVLHERVARTQRAGMVAALAGVALVSAG